MKKLKQRRLEKMIGYAGDVIEITGDNDHPIIDASQRLLGLPEDAAYCVALPMRADCIALAERMGLDATNETVMRRDVLPALRKISAVSAGCTELMLFAKQRGTWIPRERAGDAEPGDGVIFDFTRPGGKLSRHFGVLLEKPSGGVLRTVEGNTSPDHDTPVESNDARKNGGVWLKKRSLLTRPGYKVLGFVRGPE